MTKKKIGNGVDPPRMGKNPYLLFFDTFPKVLMFSRGRCDGLRVASHRGTWLST